MVRIGKRVEDYIADCYKKDEFLKSYAYSIEPISGENNWPKSENEPLKPPQYKTMPGRPKKKRTKAPEEEKSKETSRATEKVGQIGKDIYCSNCNEMGHNKRGCKKPRVQTEVLLFCSIYLFFVFTCEVKILIFFFLLFF